MSVFVVGHGVELAGEQIFVPPHQTLKFYAKSGESAILAIGYRALAEGLPPLDTVAGGSHLVNCTVGQYTDQERAHAEALRKCVDRVLFAGDGELKSGIRLCENRGNPPCDENSLKAPGAKHTCNGVLGKLADVPEIYFTICRSQASGAPLSYAADMESALPGVTAAY